MLPLMLVHDVVGHSPKRINPLMPGGDLYERINDLLAKMDNGEKVDTKARDKVLFFWLQQAGKDIEEIKRIVASNSERVEKLEENSFLMIAKAHPKATLAIVSFVVAITIIWIDHLKMWTWVFDLFGIPVP